MTSPIHPSATIDRRAELGPDVIVGPYSVIGPEARIGESAEIGAHVVIEGATTIGRGCIIGHGAIIGGSPQDLKYRGELTRVDVGDATRIREYATINRGTGPQGITRIGARCFLMTYVHVAHDCAIGDDTVIANAVQLAGHVTIGHHAWIGGSTPIHQFVRVGEHAFVGGGSRVPRDIPPFARAAGNPLRLCGINVTGLRRAGFATDVRLALQRAYRVLFNSDLTRAAALERVQSMVPLYPEVDRLAAFVAGSDRGVTVP
ncbi:MAG TPA: acyl-ACP--UDP-N-acetylglucosamine O-acyltransferase [Gemmatimonadales bacterium]